MKNSFAFLIAVFGLTSFLFDSPVRRSLGEVEGRWTQDAGLEKEKILSFYGSFFKVTYPANFVASPTSPTDTYPETDITYVETDEARFLSPDKTVEFYIFSPQWSGQTDYSKKMENEKVTFEKTIQTPSETNGITTTTWITFEANDGSYFRACVLTTTETTAKAFGIKYKTQADYDKWKPAYLEFKKSLVQYAD